MISEFLFPSLEKHFPDRGLHYSNTDDRPVATFPAIHADVGDIEIYDDGDEITLVAGKFTHGHFGNYDDSLSTTQKEQAISEDVIKFLKSAFADRVVFWGAHNRVGGWQVIEGLPVKQKKGTFVWSGPTMSS